MIQSAGAVDVHAHFFPESFLEVTIVGADRVMLGSDCCVDNPMVSQFWTYKPGEFPETPAYDRNYPPIT